MKTIKSHIYSTIFFVGFVVLGSLIYYGVEGLLLMASKVGIGGVSLFPFYPFYNVVLFLGAFSSVFVFRYFSGQHSLFDLSFWSLWALALAGIKVAYQGLNPFFSADCFIVLIATFIATIVAGSKPSDN